MYLYNNNFFSCQKPDNFWNSDVGGIGPWTPTFFDFGNMFYVCLPPSPDFRIPESMIKYRYKETAVYLIRISCVPRQSKEAYFSKILDEVA